MEMEKVYTEPVEEIQNLEDVTARRAVPMVLAVMGGLASGYIGFLITGSWAIAVLAFLVTQMVSLACYAAKA